MQTVASDADASSNEAVATSWISRAAAEGRYIRLQNWVSQALPTPRDLFIYLPKLYLSDPEREFPLLLLHDGQNLFDGDLSYIHGSTWRVGSTADAEIAAGRVAPLIIVGVGNAGPQRIAEYTPTPDVRLGGGMGPQYARMLIDEVLPMVSAMYRVQPGPQAAGIAGSSLGGLISLAIALRYPDVFGLVGVLSPSLWWDDRTILKDVRSLSALLPLRIWLDMGMAEGTRHVRNTTLLAHLLKTKGWQEGVDLLCKLYPDALHNEDAWAARLPEVLRFLYPAP